MTTGKTNTIKNRTSHIWRVPGPPRHTYLARLRESVKEQTTEYPTNGSFPQTQ